MNADSATNSWQFSLDTSKGVFLVGISIHGISQLGFPTSRKNLTSDSDKRPSDKVLRWRDLAHKALQISLRGGQHGPLPPFDWSNATLFQCRVWEALLRIPYGRTVSYGELAKQIGSPKAARATGSACGANPIPVLVPCHRVLAANGGLGGYSAGLKWKRRLLELEGVSVED